MCGTTKQTIYKYEIGKVVNIPLDRLETIADAIGVSPAYLAGWGTSTSNSAAARGNGIGDRIRSCRLQLELTQTQLGSLLGVKKNAVSKWECGRVSDIPLSKIRAMADLFHVPVSYLADDSMSAPTTLKPANTSPNLVRLTYGGATTEKALSSEQALALKMIIDQLPEADDL